jgi:two-component system LytT family sensor kinase
MNTKLNKSDYIILAIFFGISILMETYDYNRQGYLFLEYVIDLPTGVLISFSLIYVFLLHLIPKHIVENRNYFKFSFFGLLALTFFGGIEYVLGFWSAGNDWAKFPEGINLIFKAIDNGSEAVGFPLGILLTKKFYEGQTQIFKIEKQQKENELKLLRSQIDPHFLFNNLNTLDSLIDSNAEKAKEYINRLSLIYRYLIQTKDAEVMELSKELQFAENYIFLINTRFSSDYEFTIMKNINIANKFIPTGAIQALLENVVKHNKSEDKIAVKTTILINDGWLIISNTKSNTDSSHESFGTGLENLKARYKLLSDKQIQIHNMDKKFEVFIPIITLSE